MSLGRDPHRGGRAGEPSEALRRALEAWVPPEPRADFARELRRDFVTGSLGRRATLTGGLDAWELPVPDPRFRARLRARFLAGPSATARTLEASAAVGPPPGTRFGRRAFLALAAVLLLALSLWWVLGPAPGPPSGWRLLEGASSDVLLVADGGQAIPWGERSLVRAFDAGGCSIRTSGEALQVLRQGSFLIGLSVDSEVRILPRAEFGEDLLVIELSRGGLQIATATGEPRFVRVLTPDLEVELRGAAVAVDVYPGRGTCVCTLDGQALARERGAPQTRAWRPIPAGSAWFVGPAVGEVESEIPDDHREPLSSLLEVARLHSVWL